MGDLRAVGAHTGGRSPDDGQTFRHMNNCRHRREIQVAPMTDWTDGIKIPVMIQ